MGFVLHDYQTTLKSRATLTGTGVHSGNSVTVHFLPADADTGVVFQLSNGSEDREFRALVSEVGATDLCTMLGDPAGEHIATVEHLMATLFGLGIDNVVIEIDGHEVPILDGSAMAFVEAIDQAGIDSLPVKRRYIRLVKPVRIENGASWAEFRPYDGTRFEIEIDFESPAIGRQLFASDMNADIFRRDIARARTFGFMKDVERLWAAGYALGSSLENSLVIGDDNRVINMGGLRYPNEFVRHKTMDAMGDLALAGARFIGCFRSYRGGHRLNAAALRRLLSDRSAFEIVETTRRERGRTAEMSAVYAPVYAPWMI
ncbi:MAG: UDP-3-O-acyl-N-acetylglucosamine deacetylase [Mesorhizobium sp.]|jgi:UDP-3-O-[3-hydroxymyristoyl] N-acetylglucosamine deacetylase|uniref:UDP-3-O-acyl-N-acetylglucosamine deacetylase n=1 Tax=unclassified Mesorhizobium TaxID=325217 RepID=UPI0004946C6A|nr:MULTISPECIES: UDP-3-O-acyl-N-acetylglucosamine deacetylase [Mesorhizobium]RUV83733.1 UDP-3-O-acyl-N-acetylglucosamine deacetylase [Mesorhizobium sp. M5C.F.Ca.IN.020.14.1.1]QIA22900.1 UDP-3-O-acyl-N-acetylglucosamine deacetylase [Mesorhizobium sp. AA22]RUV64570.1 UDP-3-O-acyl-N-acetylglucosamine deacetylase [Mesorhizobium sp. M5C.F.Ca.IN.020.29.1.1]RWC40331.1 MAG: UDP-3-O-acyl-N-acetylglucosamine deacetylase [Mesorhizobium sp.]RWD50039.1 MAG: UDP-3-O-acyl-N-acetylglucosamine deacetylase [Mes